MTIRVGVNGFGRMGRLVLRAAWESPAFDMVQVNEIATDAAGSAHLLQFDSVHGTWANEFGGDEAGIHIGDRTIGYSRDATIGETDWSVATS